jgi:tetratricopeptide (TPR) repeat protein
MPFSFKRPFGRRNKKDLSIVLVAYNMAREIPRTLLSLSAGYQRDIRPEDYEVIVVDNGSNPPLDRKILEKLPGTFRLLRIDNASPSPAGAVNRGIAAAEGDVIGVMVDGARIVTPSLAHFARHGVRLYPRAVVATLGWYLGYDFQRWSMRSGYDQAQEDALLAAIEWPKDGYRLFEIATMDESSVEGWFQPIAESNALFMRREMWGKLGGMEERFDVPGGGYVNLDTFRRAMELTDTRLVVLLGEATFHQLHGGIATNVPVEQVAAAQTAWVGQYRRIRSRDYTKPTQDHAPTYLGTLPRSALSHLVRAAIAPVRAPAGAPLGENFDLLRWSPRPVEHSSDPAVAAAIDVAQREFTGGRYQAAVAVARLIRTRAPEAGEPQRLLSLLAGALEEAEPPHADSEFFLALGEANRLFGANELALEYYRKALSLDPNLVQAHIGMATIRMPGDFYYDWLERLYSALAPETVIEIGVADGASLARVQPPTVAIGVDPNPKVIYPLKAETHIFPETSDAFFARHGADALLAGRRLGIGFIDGLHLYEQALKDFTHLESYCGPSSAILLHDTVPLDEPTQSRARDTQFHTGDVWKTVLCLKHYRPDLDVFTIAAPWTGLTVVTGLDAGSRVLVDRYDEAVARFIDLPFAEVKDNMHAALNLVPNDWAAVEARLVARGILNVGDQ